MIVWIITHWMWLLLAFFITEKIVKLTPSKQDDIVIDVIGKSVWTFSVKAFKYVKAAILKWKTKK